LLQAFQHIRLGQVTGIDQQQPQFFVAHVGGAVLEELVLGVADLVGAVQDGCQAVVFGTHPGVCQLALAEGDLGGIAGSFQVEQPGFVRQVNQVEELCDGKIAKITL